MIDVRSRRGLVFRGLLILVAAFGRVESAAACQDDDEDLADSTRPYADGPLTADDFQAPVPNDRTVDGHALDAYTETEIHYRFRYRYRLGDGRAVVTLTEFQCDAVLMRLRSWMRRRDDPALLDHEQGHFDITESFARRAQVDFDHVIEGDGLRRSSTSRSRAEALLKREIDRRMEVYLLGSQEANREYDRITQHGNLADAQAEQRREHHRILESIDR